MVGRRRATHTLFVVHHHHLLSIASSNTLSPPAGFLTINYRFFFLLGFASPPSLSISLTYTLTDTHHVTRLYTPPWHTLANKMRDTPLCTPVTYENLQKIHDLHYTKHTKTASRPTRYPSHSLYVYIARWKKVAVSSQVFHIQFSVCCCHERRVVCAYERAPMKTERNLYYQATNAVYVHGYETHAHILLQQRSLWCAAHAHKVTIKGE